MNQKIEFVVALKIDNVSFLQAELYKMMWILIESLLLNHYQGGLVHNFQVSDGFVVEVVKSL